VGNLTSTVEVEEDGFNVRVAGKSAEDFSVTFVVK